MQMLQHRSRRTKSTFTRDFPYLRCPSSGGYLDITITTAPLSACAAHASWESRGKAGSRGSHSSVTAPADAACRRQKHLPLPPLKPAFTKTASRTETCLSTNLGVKLLMSLGEVLAFSINTRFSRKNNHYKLFTRAPKKLTSHAKNQVHYRILISDMKLENTNSRACR